MEKQRWKHRDPDFRRKKRKRDLQGGKKRKPQKGQLRLGSERGKHLPRFAQPGHGGQYWSV